MRAEGERCNDAEVAAAATAQRPEKLRAMLRRRADITTVGEHVRSFNHVVNERSMLTQTAAEATTKRESGDPNRWA